MQFDLVSSIKGCQVSQQFRRIVEKIFNHVIENLVEIILFNYSNEELVVNKLIYNQLLGKFCRNKIIYSQLDGVRLSLTEFKTGLLNSDSAPKRWLNTVYFSNDYYLRMCVAVLYSNIR